MNNGETVKRFGYHVKRFRTKEGWTQRELGAKCGRSHKVVVWIETAHQDYFPDLSTLEAMARVFKKDPVEFLKSIPKGVGEEGRD